MYTLRIDWKELWTPAESGKVRKRSGTLQVFSRLKWFYASLDFAKLLGCMNQLADKYKMLPHFTTPHWNIIRRKLYI